NGVHSRVDQELASLRDCCEADRFVGEKIVGNNRQHYRAANAVALAQKGAVLPKQSAGLRDRLGRSTPSFHGRRRVLQNPVLVRFQRELELNEYGVLRSDAKEIGPLVSGEFLNVIQVDQTRCAADNLAAVIRQRLPP